MDPPWLVVPLSDTNTAKVTITPYSEISNIYFFSENSGIAAASPAIATKSIQPVTVTGVTKGETVIESHLGSPGIMLDRLNVTIKNRKTLKVSIHLMKDSVGHFTTATSADADTIINTMNNCYTPQANVLFAKQSVDSPTVSGDLGDWIDTDSSEIDDVINA